ncbi:ABC transporter permease [Chondrinema litorale]|uniref:ABC transporter permease n=1 Tax=Chondrinema litorale TaxID=2994555 RepID=UPI002543DE26|nr:ABC transporter permease [Chondrinema litorale]UZR97265.1 ABC transporter permease [Chondrinema litorale]
MIKNYLLTTIRHLLRNRLFSLINISGFALGIICFFLIYIYVSDELSYDQYHSKADRIYRIKEFFKGEGGTYAERSSSLPFPVAEAIVGEFPNLVEEGVRFFNFQAPMLSVEYEATEKAFNEKRFFFVDENYYKVFDFELAQGNPENALAKPNTVLITENIAKKYFGENWQQEKVIGESIKFQGEYDLMITGILKDARLDSHFQYDFLASFSSLKPMFGGHLPHNNWYWNPCWTYLLLKEGVDANQLEYQLPAFVNKAFDKEFNASIVLGLQQLTDIHLNSDLDFEIQPNSNISSIYIFAGIAIFVLLIACINFVNLSTATSIQRAKEVGIRKTLGGRKHQLVFQFLTESVLMSAFSVFLAIVSISLIMPWFNTFTGKAEEINLLNEPVLLMGVIIFTVCIGVISGFYPAMILSSFKPITILKSLKADNKGAIFRKLLVTLQFVVSIILIIGTFVAIKQLRYLQSTDTGFQQENIVMVPVLRTPMADFYETYKEEVLKHNSVKSVTALEEILGAKHQGGNYQFEGMTESQLFSRLCIRHDFLETFDINLLAGRAYSMDMKQDHTYSLMINKKLAETQGWLPEEAIGKSFDLGKVKGNVIGVVDDFHFTSRHKPITPLVLDLDVRPGAFNLFIKYMAIRVDDQDMAKTLGYLQNEWEKIIPGRPFEYFFLDQNLQQLYESEEKLSSIAGIFAIIAIIVASLGLLGLSAYMTEQRKKEISIRKVLGSSIWQVIILLSGNFMNLILIAFVIACPLAYFGLDFWLNQFAYRVDIEFIYFVYAGLAVLFFAFLTISVQTIRTAYINPAYMLKDD